MKKRGWLLALLLTVGLMLSACGSRLGANSWPELAVANDTAYLAGGTGVLALNADDGQIAWGFVGGEKGFSAYAAPALSPDGKMMIVGDYEGRLYALTPEGKLLWSRAIAASHFIAPPLVTAQAIYAPNADGHLYALSPDGKTLWTFKADGQPLWGTPVTDGERLYVPSLGHHLYAVDLHDGTLIWDADLGGSIPSRPTLVDGVLYVGTFAKQVVALQAADGKVLWKAKADDWVWSAPAYTEGKLFFGDLSGKIWALDATDGHTLWSQATGSGIVGQPAIADQTLFFATEDGKVLAYSLDGKPQWEYTLQGKLYASPVVHNGQIFVTAYKSDFLAAALTTDGRPKWLLATKDAEAALKASQPGK